MLRCIFNATKAQRTYINAKSKNELNNLFVNSKTKAERVKVKRFRYFKVYS